MYIISDYNCEINCINWSAGTKDIEKKVAAFWDRGTRNNHFHWASLTTKTNLFNSP